MYFRSHHNTWEPITNIEPARKLAKAFDKKQDALDEEEATKDFEVEKIVEEKIRRNKPCFLVKWKGFNKEYVFAWKNYFNFFLASIHGKQRIVLQTALRFSPHGKV